jgi:hypothetical protein
MTTYETKIMERLKVLDDRRKADSYRLEKLIEKKYNDQYVKLEKLIEKKYKDEYVKLQRELELCRTNVSDVSGYDSSGHFAFSFLP